MRDVYFQGVGMVKCGRFNERIEINAARACINALKDAGINWREVQAAYATHVMQGVSAGQKVVSQIGLTGLNVTNVENACASGSTGIHHAYYDVASGKYDIVLVVGFEKMQKGVIDSNSGERSYEDKMGMRIMPGEYAMKAQRHMYEYGTTPEQMARVSVKNHKNGCYNPYAHYQKELTLEEVLHSRMISDPLTLLQACPTSDGAAAAILVSENVAKKNNNRDLIKLIGTSVQTESVFEEEDLTTRTANTAYEMANVGPEDINLAEVHDAFTIGELLHYEALGFCELGESGRLIDEGVTEISGSLPVSPSGGLQSRGHPLGMTGIAQVCEIVWQLRGESKQRQVRNNPKVGLTHTQGAGGVCSVSIISK
ncbi:thiolase family protein [Salicibibacter kimchii]|uniref:Thiolase family protein n=1 Tax=Salicibibacter kimchii TaxID=2099786 RepID=A0A345BW42_9BACI|nr:thiolase family protein [Salicibibacter kimchii]AXF55173.1 thiolase family protein [Salicibibacter kimchii]